MGATEPRISERGKSASERVSERVCVIWFRGFQRVFRDLERSCQ